MKKFITTILLALVGIIGMNAEQWALVRFSVEPFRSEPGSGKEQSTQGLMGMPVKIIGEDGDWCQVEMPDGYKAWVIKSRLKLKTDEEMLRWRTAPRLMVTSPMQVRAYNDPFATGMRDGVTDLISGNIVEGTLKNIVNDRVHIVLPDGREAWAPKDALIELKRWATRPFDAQFVLDQAYALEGVPYLWGGNSGKGLDCSGLVKVAYFANGIILQRDASMQINTGHPIHSWQVCQPGDLLFFSSKPNGKVTHVAIYDHDGWFVHSAGYVHRNSMNPDDNNMSPGHYFLRATRIGDQIGTKGIVKAIEHPWYFEM